MNYLHKKLREEIPHTDTRLRPDQRALENGDFALASKEKIRLEEKQRAVRRYMEKAGIEHKPKYFEPWTEPPSKGNPNVKHTQNDPIQYKYNGLYFE
jgi:oxysterol-binding protein 1